MLDELDSDSLVAEVVLAGATNGVVLLVEGDLDQHFAETHLGQLGPVVNGRGKQRILQALPSVLRLTVPTVVMMDRDFDVLLGIDVTHERVVYTDRYNLEATLLADGPTFDRLWRSHVWGAGLKRLSSDSALRLALALAGPVGELRLLCRRLLIDLDLSSFPIGALVGRTTPLSVVCADEEGVIRLAIKRSARSRWLKLRRTARGGGTMGPTSRYLRRKLADQRRMFEGADLISGHDIASAVNVLMAMCRTGGTPSARDLEFEAVVQFQREDSPTVTVADRVEEAALVALATVPSALRAWRRPRPTIRWRQRGGPGSDPS